MRVVDDYTVDEFKITMGRNQCRNTHARTHTRTHARARTHTHTHTHELITGLYLYTNQLYMYIESSSDNSD